MKRAGVAHISNTKRGLSILITQTTNFTVRHYSINLESLRKLLEGEIREVPVWRVRE